MAEYSSIEWTDATWNPITGCSVVSPGCTNCYAMKLAGGRLQHHPTRQGLTTPSKAGPVWNGQVRLNEGMLTDPLRWRRPRRIFVCAHGDLFHESVPDAWIDRVFAVMAAAPHLTFQVLTKRAERMRAYIESLRDRPRFLTLDKDSMVWSPYEGGWPTYIWLGVSAEDQARADERIPHLLQTPAAVRFLSAEPLLGPIDLTDLNLSGDSTMDALTPMSAADHWRTQWAPEVTGETLESAIEGFEDWGFSYPPSEAKASVLDWVIVGGESGPGARPMHPDWARQIRDDCAAAGVAFFFKQWGDWGVGVGGDELDEALARRDFTLADDGELVFAGNSRFAGRPSGIIHANFEAWNDFGDQEFYQLRPYGKVRAGRLLDGVEHNAMPGAR